jgi:hypothetical protein
VSDTRRRIEEELVRWMSEDDWRPDEARFDDLARRLFAFQFEHCAPYRRFCEARNVTPSSVDSWKQIPAVPTGAFKELALRCFDESATLRTFRTSGTSLSRRGELHLDSLALYEASLLPTIRRLLFPDLKPGERMPIRVLAPSPDELPDSSLSYMFGCAIEALGSSGSAFDVIEDRLDVDSLLRACNRAIADDQPLALCGTAYAFVHWLDALTQRELRLALPTGSRVMETGGFKGRSREISRPELYRALEARLGVPQQCIVNQYGMTELASQFYDSVLREPKAPRRKIGPPWARVRIVDPNTGADAVVGALGMIVIHDLANTGSIAAVETADLGRRTAAAEEAGDGFEIAGREPDAEARGCSIAADAMLAGTARQ